MHDYELVNPSITGNIKKTFSSSDSNTAASEAWNELSQYMANNTPKFAFSLKREDGKLYHFSVKEKLGKNKSVKFTVKPLKLNLSKEQENGLLNHISDHAKKMNGGKHKSKDDSDSSDSSSDSDSDTDSDLYDKIRKFKNKPLNYLWYNPLVYTTNGKLESVYIPTFTYPIVPYFEISLTGVYYKL